MLEQKVAQMLPFLGLLHLFQKVTIDIQKKPNSQKMPNLVTLPFQQFFKLHLHDL